MQQNIKLYTQNISIKKRLFNIIKKKNNIINIIKTYQNKKTYKNSNKNTLNNKKKNYKINNLIYKIEKKINYITKNTKIYKKNNSQEMIKEEFKILNLKLKKIEYFYLFPKKHDLFNCYIDIKAGSGGNDAKSCAKILFHMYKKWAELKKFKIQILYKKKGEISGIKSTTFKIIGKYAYGWIKKESGIHRFIRKSPFNSNKKRHTSFCSVFIYPEIQKKLNIKINKKDLKIDVYKSSGSGGQHINKTKSAIRITHLPTNIVTQCQNERSQHRNKSQAIKQLQSKLYKLEIYKKNIQKNNIKKNKPNISWSNQIRSYVLDKSYIKDIRTGIKTNKIQNILNGNIKIFL